jgi:threonine dehydrogenase-like Zn-dependent dehydrogenase
MGVSVKAAPFDVRAYPMWRTAHVLALAKRAIQHGMIRLNPLITHRPHFSDVQAVQQAFTLHATGGRMKTVVRFDPIEKNHPVESSP